MPRASERIDTTANPGAMRNCRTTCRRSIARMTRTAINRSTPILQESSSSTILSIMRIQKWTMAAAMAASFGQAQVPIDSRPTVPAVIPDSVSVEANIPYDHYKETVLDILQPKAPSKEKRPGVILIHGGGWVNGTKEQRVEYAALKYAQKGFVVANVEYRLAAVATAPAAVTDVLKAARWFQKNAKKYNVDSKRIAVTGDSAGGHLALMVAMTPR